MSTSQRNKQHAGAGTADPFPNFSEAQLRSTMDSFMEEEETNDQPNIWNTATIAGIAMFLVSTIYILHLIGLNIVPDIGAAFIPLVIIGALLVGFVGFGFLVGDRKRIKRILKTKKKKKEDYFDQAFPGDREEEEEIDLEEELFGNSTSTSQSYGSKQSSSRQSSRYSYGSRNFSRKSYDGHTMKKSKKLYRSRTDKKIAGVCGGLSEYFGISSTLLRVIFVVSFFVGSGASLLLYIALMIALSKEPQKPLPDYDF